jgi:hypothetical protein
LLLWPRYSHGAIPFCATSAVALLMGPNRRAQERERAARLRGTEYGLSESSCMGANSSRAERCRLKAEECRLMAERARDPKTKADLLDLARQWLALAAEAKHEAP